MNCLASIVRQQSCWDHHGVGAANRPLCAYSVSLAPNCSIAQLAYTINQSQIVSEFRYRPETLKGMPGLETDYLKQYEQWFILGPDQLKRITDHRVARLKPGLSKEGGNIARYLLRKRSKAPGTTPRLRDGIAHESNLGDGILFCL